MTTDKKAAADAVAAALISTLSDTERLSIVAEGVLGLAPRLRELLYLAEMKAGSQIDLSNKVVVSIERGKAYARIDEPDADHAAEAARESEGNPHMHPVQANIMPMLSDASFAARDDIDVVEAVVDALRAEMIGAGNTDTVEIEEAHVAIEREMKHLVTSVETTLLTLLAVVRKELDARRRAFDEQATPASNVVPMKPHTTH